VEVNVLDQFTLEVVDSEQTLCSFDELLMTGNSLTVSKTVLVLLQIPSDPVSVYVVVVVGLAETFIPEVEDKPTAGDQLYVHVGLLVLVVAPSAFKEVDVFLQISEDDGVMVKVGFRNTLIIKESLFLQLLISVAVTIYLKSAGKFEEFINVKLVTNEFDKLKPFDGVQL
jgi:hypothetical protein